jgi:hypothetical protein
VGPEAASRFPRLASARILAQVQFLGRPLTDLSMEETYVGKTFFELYFVLLNVPCIVVVLGVLFAVPPLMCTSCQEVFMEMEIGFLVLSGIQSFVALRSVYIAYMENGGYDTRGVIKETLLCSICVGSMVGLTSILTMIDPNDLSNSRVFSWPSIVFLTGVVLWGITSYQFYIQWTDDRANKTKARRTSIARRTTEVHKMIPTLEADAALRARFEEFVERRYMAESWLFLENVKAFKSMYYDKPDNWKQTKITLLVRNYIQDGSRLELNISDAMKNRVLDNCKTLNASSLTLFDEAFEEIVHILEQNVWPAFSQKIALGRKEWVDTVQM